MFENQIRDYFSPPVDKKHNNFFDYYFHEKSQNCVISIVSAAALHKIRTKIYFLRNLRKLFRGSSANEPAAGGIEFE